MPDTDVTLPDHPVLVVAYDDKSRAALTASLGLFGVPAISCATFVAAESYALTGSCQGILVDLATMIKAKDEEKAVAYTLTGIYPALRVKTMGSMLIPMIMAGDAKQDNSLKDFLTKTCAAFLPRKLRSNKRKVFCLPTHIGGERGFTVDISWSGAFIADMNPERFGVGSEITVHFLPEHGVELAVEVSIVRIQRWGEHRPPGIGVQFKQIGEQFAAILFALLKSDKDKGRDRLAA